MTVPSVDSVARAQAFAHLEAAADDVLAHLAAGDGGDPALLEHLDSLHTVTERLIGGRALLIERVRASGRWREQGARSLTRFLTQALGILPATAREAAKLGRSLTEHLPAMARGVLGGEIGIDQAKLAATHTARTEARLAALRLAIEVEVEVEGGGDGREDGDGRGDGEAEGTHEVDGGGNVAGNVGGDGGSDGDGGGRCDGQDVPVAQAGWWVGIGVQPIEPGPGLPLQNTVRVEMSGEEHLAMLASQFRAEDFRTLIAHWCARLDPGGLEDDYRQAEEREYLELAKTIGGYHIGGFLSEKTGQLLKTALDTVHAPPAYDDERTTSQRRAADLANLAERFLAAALGGTTADAQPHLAVAVSYDTLKQLTAAHTGSGLDLDQLIGTDPARWQDGSGPIPHTLLQELMCDSTVARYVFGPANEILNLGREARFFNRAQRRALLYRDGQCVYPSCTAPGTWCDGHHALPHSQGGPTDLANGALLCAFHHRMFHRKGFTMRRDAVGRWRFRRRSGQEITTALPRLRQ